MKIRSFQCFPWSPFWTVLLAIFALAAIVRLLSFAVSLPFIYPVDEPNFYWKAMSWRGLYDRGGLQGYPPLIIILNIGMQLLTERLGQHGPSATIYGLRLLAVGYSLLILLFTAITARRIAGDLAGLVTAATWAISPMIVQISTTALADPLDFMFVAAALWAAVIALQDSRRRHWCIWSVIFGLFAVLAKYPVFPAIIPGGLVALVIFFRDRRRGFIYLTAQAVIVIGVVTWLFMIYQAQQLDYHYPSLKIELGARIYYFTSNFYYALVPIDPTIFVVFCTLGVALFLTAPHFGWQRAKGGPLVLAVVLLFSMIFVASLFSPVVLTDRARDVWPVTSTACVILGVAVAQLTYVIPRGWGRYARWLPTALLTILFFAPQCIATSAYIQQAQLEDVRVAVRNWTDINLDPGTFIVGGENTRLFNPFYGGIQGRKWFDWWITNNIVEHSVAEWRDVRKISYAAISLFRLNMIESTPEGKVYINQMLRVRDFVPPPARLGEPIIIYALHTMDVQTQHQFGDRIALLGYDRSAEQAAPGNEVKLRFYWQSKSTPQANYSVYVHLVSMTERQPLAQVDGPPAHPERPSVTWDDPKEILLSETISLKLSRELAPGQYRLLMGLYDYGTGQRLLTPEGDDYILLYTLTVI